MTAEEDRAARYGRYADGIRKQMLTSRALTAVLGYIADEAAYLSRERFNEGFEKGMARGREECSCNARSGDHGKGGG